MSNYKVGDKVVLTITSKDEKGYYPIYVLNDNFYISEQGVDEHTEPLSIYTESLEDTIQKYTVKIARLVMEKEGLKDENERLKAENEKMSVKIDAYELCGDQHEEEYNQAFNQGAEAAWELARKGMLMSSTDREAIFGSGCNAMYGVLVYHTYQEAAAKVAEWENAKEEIKVGDVLATNGGKNAVVTKVFNDGDVQVLFESGKFDVRGHARNLKKTGRHIDIDSLLKQIGGGE